MKRKRPDRLKCASVRFFVVAALCALSAAVALAAEDSPVPPSAPADPAERALARMSALAKEEKWQELVDQFKDVDFSAWPKAGDAFYYRGCAYSGLGKAVQAERDLKASVEREPKEGYFWYNLGELYRGALKDPLKAAEAYKKAAMNEDRRGWMPADAALKAADIYLYRVEPDAALEALKTFGDEDLERVSAMWRVRILRARGRALAAQGMEQEALAEFKKALAVEGRE